MSLPLRASGSRSRGGWRTTSSGATLLGDDGPSQCPGARLPEPERHPRRRALRHVGGDVHQSVWKAYSALAGTHYEPERVRPILHPRRLAWARGTTTGLVADELFPGVVPSAGIPARVRDGDVALVVERSSVVLLGAEPAFRVFPQVASS